ncbi:MAG TPA: phosphomannomutase/phosphoglucomutase [Spirochaetia bacterium]|nr:phosphomannomutase/phosphoglucomutase [Spirochaetia bacterium]
MSVFKSYDIRGVFGKEWDGATARAIGQLLPGLLRARRIGVGRDVRLSSEEVFRELSAGITSVGCDVADLGLCDTPAVYFSTAFYKLDGSVMVTASHNPPEYNGMKVSGREAASIGYDTGLAQVEKLLQQGALPAWSKRPGSVKPLDIRTDYLAHLARFRSDLSGVRAVIDCSNGMAGLYLRDILKDTGGRFEYMFDEPDGRFPNHAPNPLVEENLAALKKSVVSGGADLGICFDGDADRVMFIDETGRFISPDLFIALLGDYYFRLHPERLAGGSKAVTYDIRTSRCVVEHLEKLGADPRICRVGHTHAIKLLRETRGIVGGELAGHYYFREFFFCDSGIMAALIVLDVLARSGKRLSDLLAGIRKYFFSGEINFTVPNGAEIVEKVRGDYKDGRLTDIDGIRLDFPAWWFNLRVSNTEPLLRLAVETVSEEDLEPRKNELIEKIRRYSRPDPATREIPQ